MVVKEKVRGQIWDIFEVELICFFYGLSVEYESKKEVKDDVKGFSMKNCVYQ